MSSATALYHVRLAKESFALGGVEFQLKNGLLATVEGLAAAHRNDKKLLRTAIAPALGIATKDVDKIKAVLEDHAQVEWYRAKGAECPPAIVDRLAELVNAANAANAAPPEPADGAEPAPAVGPRAKVGRAGGPTGLARKLIADGVDSDEIMRQVKAQFGPGSATPLKFERGDLNRLRRKIEEKAGLR